MFDPAFPIELPPSRFVKETAKSLPRHESLLVLDAGAYEGRNSTFLAKLGHRVVAMTNEYEDAMRGADIARHLDEIRRKNCQFVVGDIRQLGVAPGFDVVLINEVLHQMTKQQANATLDELRDVTRPGGLHITSGYLINPREASVKNRTHCFRANELLLNYVNAGWNVHTYEEESVRTAEFNGQQIVHSLAKIVASK